MKTNKAMKARFKVTGTGKLVRHKQGRKHILTKKSSNKKRYLSREVLVTDAHAAKYKRMMGA
jgi:large subunit ribosomal protein L35